MYIQQYKIVNSGDLEELLMILVKTMRIFWKYRNTSSLFDDKTDHKCLCRINVKCF